MSYPTLDDILTRLERVTGEPPHKVGAGFKAMCPAHEDVNPSLSIKAGDKHPFILKCHAGCTFTDVMTTLGYSNGKTKPVTVATAGKLKKKKRGAKKLGKLTARYDYHDAEGNVIFCKLRYEPKDYRVSRPGVGYGLGDVEPVPYNLHLIAESDPQDVIFLVEGEKDADNLLWAMDAITTTTFDGASKDNQKPKWRESYNRFFEGRRVVCLPDNDSAGLAHMNHAAKSLAHVVEWVKVVQLPNLPDKGDASDWLARDPHPALLWQLVEEAEPVGKGLPSEINIEHPKTIDYRKAIKWLGYNARMNTLDNTTEVNGRRLSDVVETRIRSEMLDLGFKGRDRIIDALTIEADEHRFHPIQEFLTTLEWDGQDYIAMLFGRYISEATNAGVVAFKRWLIGSVAKVMRPGETQNYMLVIDGAQDAGKSTFVRWLCPVRGYHVESQIQTDNKDHNRLACTKWVWEVPEVDATTKRSDVSALKDFLTKQEHTFRKPYDRHDVTYPALASFIGTINSDGVGFLRDKTGNRRFFPIYFETVDFAYSTEVDPAQIWAQAYTLYRDGESWELTKEEKRIRDHINRTYETDSIVEVMFFDYFTVEAGNKNIMVPASDVLTKLEENGLKGNQRMNYIELKSIVHKYGGKATRRTLADGSKGSVYLGVKPLFTEIQL